MTNVNYINLFLQIFGAIFSIVTLICVKTSNMPKDMVTKVFKRFIILNTTVMLADATALVFRGYLDVISWWMVRLGNGIAYSANFILLATAVRFITEYISKKGETTRIPLTITRITCTLSVISVFLTYIYPIYYWIDENNIYHRGRYFWTSQVMGIVGLAMCSWMLIKYHKKLDSQEKKALYSIVALPIIALIIQIYSYGIAVLNLANMMVIIVLFIFMQARQGQILLDQEKKLNNARISIMLSQIQPHFLYNTLTAISVLCDKDPKIAKKATIDFSEYLRGNLDSLSYSNPIPFEKEFEHANLYLGLEKMRFDEELTIKYNIGVTDFSVPALSIQPLVENAVKYGVGQKEDGGTVYITTKETKEEHIILIEDDGVGYDVNETKYDGRTHIGIDNVRARLEEMVCGKLEIKSQKGVGTRAIMTIPKGGYTNENISSR